MTAYTNEEKQALRPPQRVTRYVYHVHGHAKLHDTQDRDGPAVPFEAVLRYELPITSDAAMDSLRGAVRAHIVGELDKQGSPYLVGDVMVRGVSLLHTILVNNDDLDGQPARVIS